MRFRAHTVAGSWRPPGRHLLDPEIGIRTVAPADFHTDSVKAQYKVKGNEAGDAYWYANGGIWYLGNAWYTAALKAIGEDDSALAFYRRTMTLDGITQSPQGQPALHEYRYGDPASPQRGLVDKPTMMWAAGFCIGTAYRLAGFQDNVWNVTVAGSVPGSFKDITATYMFGTMKRVDADGNGRDAHAHAGGRAGDPLADTAAGCRDCRFHQHCDGSDTLSVP